MKKVGTGGVARAKRTRTRRALLQNLLDHIRDLQPISRADLARHLDLNRGTITSLVDELLADHTIVEGPTIDAPRGRRPRMLYARTRDRVLIVVDVQFRRTRVSLCVNSARTIAEASFRTIADPDALVAQLAETIRQLLNDTVVLGRLEGVEVLFPGAVDPAHGRVLSAPQFGWRNVGLGETLAQATGLAVTIENTAVVCARAQLVRRRRGTAPNDFVYLHISDSVTGAVVSNGELLRGATFSAGQFGHMPIHPAGPRCLCGARGCLEAYISDLATIARYLGLDPARERDQGLLLESDLTVAALIERARGGDERARAAIRKTRQYLRVGLAAIGNTVDPARIVVGGEIAAAGDVVVGRVGRRPNLQPRPPITWQCPPPPWETAGISRIA